MNPNEFRIFLSSTFTDLQPEREQLVKKVFPQIRALCRERGVEFTEIDLRWGITDEEARSGKVIRICLEEIDKCRPYFLCILGSRYGWRPQISDIEKDEELLAIYPWLREFVSKDKSIVELEVTYGALQSEYEGSSFFYEQNCDDKISEADKASYDKLKQTLHAAGLLDHKFNTPEELGEQVLHDLSAILDRDWPLKKEMTPAERERNAHEAFALNRTHSYIANPEYYERFEKFVDQDSGTDFSPSGEKRTEVRSTEARSTDPLILWGKSGFGKSALMSYLTSEYKKQHPNAFVVRHFVGATSGASSSDDIIRHLMLEIKERYELEDELPQSNLQDELPVWLAKIKEGEKLILAIDAVNQLTGIGPEMHWLPEYIPSGVRLIISTTPEVPLEQLRKREWQELEMLPLTAKQKTRIAKEFLARYHKSLPDELLEIIGTEAKLESPLFLRTVLEELRIFGVHEAIDIHLASYLASENESELFQRVLARMERDYGKDAVQSVMSAIWASRFGLSETELIEITGLSRLLLSEFLIALEFHLMQHGGLFTFFHNYLRTAVETRYIASLPSKQAAHRHLASYFSEEPYDERRRNEEPWQWQQAEDTERFANCISTPGMMNLILDESHMQDLLGYWKYIQTVSTLPEIYHPVMEVYRKESPDAEYAELSAKLGNGLVAASSYKEAEYHLDHALNLRKKIFGDESPETVESMNELATLFYHTGKLDKAELLLKEAIGIREKTSGKNDPRVAVYLNDLGTIYYTQGNLTEAEGCFQDSLNRYESYYSRDHQEIASTLNNIGSILCAKEEYTEAIEFLIKSLSMYQRLYGDRNINLLPPIGNLAIAFKKKKEYQEAEGWYLKAIALSEAVFGRFHNLTGSYYSNVAVFYSLTGEGKKAIESHSNALNIRLKLLGEEHRDTINSYINLGLAFYRAGNKENGKRLVLKYLPIQEKMIGPNHQLYLVNKASWDELTEEKTPSTKSERS